MQVFLMHIGHPGNVDVEYTVTRRRALEELIEHLPRDAPERPYFEQDAELREAFPDSTFNCWGVPTRAEPSFVNTQIGDLVLFVPWIGVHDGGIHQIGIVRAKCPVRCFDASRILWPDTPNDRLFPFLFFFDTEVGFRSWHKFLEDMGIKENWHPRGWYRAINSRRFDGFGGPDGYLRFLRTQCQFAPARIAPDPADLSTADRSAIGAGFGDHEENKLVETAAINFATAWYNSNGWSVERVDQEKRGYDLVCRKKSKEAHVEVKGIRGMLQSFIITSGEVRQARMDPDFQLFVVTSALSAKPMSFQYSGQKFLSKFALEAVQYRAALQK